MLPRRRILLATTIPRTAHLFYRELFHEFKSRGFEVHLATSDGPEISSLRDVVDTVHIVPMSRPVSLFKDISSFVRWITLLRRVRPNYVFCGTPKAGLLGMLSSRVVRVERRVYFLQGLRLEGVQGWSGRVLSAMERLASWSSQTVVAVSDSLAGEYESRRLSASRPVVVPHHGSSHGVNTVHFAPTPPDRGLLRSLGMSPEYPTIVFLGRLTADKGPSVLAEALDRMHSQGVYAQLLILGAQDERDSAFHSQRLVADRPWVRVVDHVSDVRPYLAASQLCVLPTRREGFPNVVLEASAMGLPCVTTEATGAIDSVIHGRTGLIVPVDDADSLSTAMRTLINDPALRASMGEAARRRAVADFQPTDVARAIADIVEAEQECSVLLESPSEPVSSRLAGK
ncbi:glycosyltransferase family 4 protein [Phycicoccus sp. Soil748]|uniref:glycosyltransferase family 4 protein n=1 Tax=Phycicoccus sp. Soil748 TaxID=1736397 RepID=UPI0009E6F4A2